MGLLNSLEYWNWIESYLNVILFIEPNVFFELSLIFERLVHMLKLNCLRIQVPKPFTNDQKKTLVVKTCIFNVQILDEK